MRSKKGFRLQVTRQADEQRTKLRAYKRRTRCSAVRIICTACRVAVIHKNSKRALADIRVCAECDSKMGPSAQLTADAVALSRRTG